MQWIANGLWYEIETDSTTARTKRLSNQRFCFIPRVSHLVRFNNEKLD